MSDNVIKFVPNELDGNSRYAVRLRSINSFNVVSDWSESLIIDTDDASAATGGRLALTSNGMIAYDANGQTSFVYSGTGVGSRTNVIKNPSFEIDTSGWIGLTSSTISRTTTDFYVGEPAYKASLKVLSSTVTSGGVGAQTTIGDRITVSAGQIYSVSAYVKAITVDVSLKIGLIFYDVVGTVIKTVYSPSPRLLTANGLWTRISSIATTTPNGSVKMGVVILSTSAMTANQYYLIDGVLAELSSTLGDYFDGSTSIGATIWTGTPHYSTSTFDLTSPYFVDGGVFTSGTVQTSTTATTTGGIVLRSTDFTAYNGVGEQTFKINAADGAVTIGNVAASTVVSGAAEGDTAIQPGGGVTVDGSSVITQIVGGLIRTGLVQSTSYSGVTDGSAYSTTGTTYNLDNGSITSKNFRITTTGDAFFAGSISGGTIDIGGADTTSFHVDATGQMWVGGASYASAPFKVSATGSLTVTGGTITGGTVQTATSGKRITLNGTTLTFLGNNDTYPPKIVFSTGNVISSGAGIESDANLFIDCFYGSINIGSQGGVGYEGNYYDALNRHHFTINGADSLVLKSTVIEANAAIQAPQCVGGIKGGAGGAIWKRSDSFGGLWYASQVGTDNNYIVCSDSASTYLRTGTGQLGFIAGTTTRASINTSGHFIPGADNTYTNGVSGTRWSAIWAANGTIQTSDMRTKNDVTDTPLGLSFINRLRPVQYRFIVGGNKVIDSRWNTETNEYEQTCEAIPGKRLHSGLIAQEVREALDAEQVEDFGGWLLTDKNDPDSEQALRYEEFIAPLIKAVQEQQVLIKSLQARIEVLEGRA